MTPRENFVSCQPGDNCGDVLKRMLDGDFDQIPVERGGRIHWYIVRSDLEACNKDAPHLVAEHSHTIEPNKLVSANSRVVDVLVKILNERFYFVLTISDIAGLVTYADFDKRPVRVLLYLLFSELETGLLSLMRTQNRDPSYWLSKLETTSEGRCGIVKRHHKRRKSQNVGLDELDCFSLIDIFLAVRADSKFLSSLGDSLDDYEELNDLRDQVSHSGLDIAASISRLDQLIGSKRRLFELLDRISSTQQQGSSHASDRIQETR